MALDNAHKIRCLHPDSGGVVIGVNADDVVCEIGV